MGTVLEESDEHGPLFSEIEVDVPYAAVDAESLDGMDGAETVAESIPDISGVWSLQQHWPTSTDTLTTLSLQQDGNSLNGFAISSPMSGTNENWMVNQEVSGFVRGNQFELAATSYQILESGQGLVSWTLDNWRGTIDSNGYIHGELFDEDGQQGTFYDEEEREEEREGQ